MNQAIEKSTTGTRGRVTFCSLVDMFNLEANGISGNQKVAELGMPDLDHHIATALKDDAELCRRILMAGCQPSTAGLRARIGSQEASILALYRGFSRFMLEDLDLHPLTQSLSRSQRKKLATKVSFEMILRNQAYSNLVELMFPDHVRLSIHAHNNAGPKFGIRLFDPATTRATASLDMGDGEVTSHDLLHIPTPWHNCVAQCVGDSTIHVLKSGAVREALAARNYTGSYVEGNMETGKGGYFSLQKVINNARAPKSEMKISQEMSQVADHIKAVGLAALVYSIPLTLYNMSLGCVRFALSLLRTPRGEAGRY